MENTEKRILESAREQFARYGYQKTSLDDIVRDVSISKGTIYNYFINKEDLFKQVVQAEYSRMFDHLVSIIENETDPAKQLIQYALNRADYINDFFSKRGSNITVIKELSDTLDHLESENPQEIGILKEIIRKGADRQAFRDNPGPDAQIIYKTIRQFELRWIQMDSKACRAEINQLFELMLRGLAS